MRVARLPAEAVGFIVANYRVSAFADDNAAGFLDQYAVAFAHLAAGAAHIIEAPGIILRGRRHKGTLRLCCRRCGWRGRGLHGRGRDRRRADRLLRRDRTRRLPGNADVALPRRLCRRRLHLTLWWKRRRRLRARRRLDGVVAEPWAAVRRLRARRRLYLTLWWRSGRLRARWRLDFSLLRNYRRLRVRRRLDLSLLGSCRRLLPRRLRARRGPHLTLLRRDRGLLSGRMRARGWLHLALLRSCRRLMPRWLRARRGLHLTLLRRRGRLLTRRRLHLTLRGGWRLRPLFGSLLLRLRSRRLAGPLRGLFFLFGLRRRLRHDGACAEGRCVYGPDQDCRQYRASQEAFFCVRHRRPRFG